MNNIEKVSVPPMKDMWRNEYKTIVKDRDFIIELSDKNNNIRSVNTSALSYSIISNDEYRNDKILNSTVELLFHLTGREHPYCLFDDYISNESELNNVINSVENLTNHLNTFKKGLIKCREKLIEVNKTKVNKPENY